jgi:hypothetical protein
MKDIASDIVINNNIEKIKEKAIIINSEQSKKLYNAIEESK